MEASYLGKRAGSVADTNYSLVLFIPPTEISLDSSEISRTVLLARLSESAALNIINIVATPLLGISLRAVYRKPKTNAIMKRSLSSACSCKNLWQLKLKF